MRKTLLFLVLAPPLCVLLAGCSSNLNSSMSTPASSASSAAVTLSMTDDPPAGVSVLFFQITLTDASLTPASSSSSSSPVSLLGSTPVQIDVTQLQALSAFLSTANVTAGNYSGLSLTFSSPQLVIFNASNTSIASSCAVGSVCAITPSVDGSTMVSLTSAPFPVTIAANSPLGFLIDFHLNTIIQSDLSVNLGVANGVTVDELPPVMAPQPPRFGFITGTVGTVNASQSQFTMQSAWGKTFTIDVDSNTAYIDWPPCVSPGGLACLTSGAVVRVEVAKVETDGTLLAAQIQWLQAAGQQTVEGTVIGYSATQLRLILHYNRSNDISLPLGGMATVTIDKNAAFSVDANGFTIPAGMVFTGVQNLTRGQEVQVALDSGTLSCATNWVLTTLWEAPHPCAFSTNSIQLEPSQMSGMVASIDSSASSFTLASFPSIAFGPWATSSAAPGITVDTTSGTTYQGFNTDSFSGLADNDAVSVNGWLFENDNGLLDPAMTSPMALAQTITLHSMDMF
jgi:hypothetical protein